MAEYLLTAISFGFRVRRDALNGYSFARWCENLYGISFSSQRSVGGLTGLPALSQTESKLEM